MPIERDLSSLPKGKAKKERPSFTWAPDDDNMLAEPFTLWQQSFPDRGRDKAVADTKYRASWAWMRCDRGLWYYLNGAHEADEGIASVWRMDLGSAGHELILPKLAMWADVHKVQLEAEVAIDLRPVGIDGSSHADFVLTDPGYDELRHYSDGDSIAVHPPWVTVVEAKTLGGFSYKRAATTFGGGPEGPKWGHVIQAVMNAKGRNADAARILYLSTEVTSPQLAGNMELTEVSRFSAQWTIDRDQIEIIFEGEKDRINSVAAMTDLPDPVIVDPSKPPGATIVNPMDGGWVVAEGNEIRDMGTFWNCGYCPFRAQCVDAFTGIGDRERR